jgi:hypothetical protein
VKSKRRRGGRILVFAKAPAPGVVKTRLAATLGEEGAASLARAFLSDTWSLLRGALKERAEAVIVLDGDPALIELDDAEIWPQGGGDLGDRLTSGLARGLAMNEVPWVIAVGTDSPGMPASLLLRAIEALERTDSVIGPCDDGGFYLLGLRRLPSGLLADLPWSEPTTFAAALARLQRSGLEPVVLDPWFDIDLPGDLDRLRALLSRGEVSAPATASALAALAALATLERGACESRS